jgi:hypothetical protein
MRTSEIKSSINYYFLIAGILAILFSITHAWNGHATVLQTLNADAINASAKATFIYVWHIITAENLLFGLTFIFLAFNKDFSKSGFAALIIAILMIARLAVIIGVTLAYNAEGIRNTLIDAIAIVIYFFLILSGIKANAGKSGQRHGMNPMS